MGRHAGLGPNKSRFDHHTPPHRAQRRAIAYLAWGPDAFTTALAEYFQDDSGAGVGPFDLVTSRPAITLFRLATEVVLLDLSGPWTTRAGGNQAICNGPRWRSRQWARAVYAAFGNPGTAHAVEGLAYRSSVWGPGHCAVLWQTAAALSRRRRWRQGCWTTPVPGLHWPRLPKSSGRTSRHQCRDGATDPYPTLPSISTSCYRRAASPALPRAVVFPMDAPAPIQHAHWCDHHLLGHFLSLRDVVIEAFILAGGSTLLYPRPSCHDWLG